MVERLTSLFAAILALLSVFGLSALLVASRASITDMPFADEIACMIKDRADCLEPGVAALRREEAELKSKLIDQRREFDMLARGGGVLTASGDLGGYYSAVMAAYVDPANKRGLQVARCSIRRDKSGPDDALLLARMAQGVIEHIAVDPVHRDAPGFTQTDIATARANCPWPNP